MQNNVLTRHADHHATADYSLVVYAYDSPSPSIAYLGGAVKEYKALFEGKRPRKISISQLHTPEDLIIHQSDLPDCRELESLTIELAPGSTFIASPDGDACAALSQLSLVGGAIKNIEALAACKALCFLHLDNNHFDLAPFSENLSIRDLKVSNHRSRNCENLVPFQSVERIFLDSTAIASLVGVDKMDRLRTLRISNARRLVSAGEVSSDSMMHLMMERNSKKFEIMSLQNMRGLRVLFVDKFSEFAHLECLKGLRSFGTGRLDKSGRSKLKDLGIDVVEPDSDDVNLFYLPLCAEGRRP